MSTSTTLISPSTAERQLSIQQSLSIGEETKEKASSLIPAFIMDKIPMCSKLCETGLNISKITTSTRKIKQTIQKKKSRKITEEKAHLQIAEQCIVLTSGIHGLAQKAFTTLSKTSAASTSVTYACQLVHSHTVLRNEQKQHQKIKKLLHHSPMQKKKKQKILHSQSEKVKVAKDNRLILCCQTAASAILMSDLLPNQVRLAGSIAVIAIPEAVRYIRNHNGNMIQTAIAHLKETPTYLKKGWSVVEETALSILDRFIPFV